MGSPTKKIQRPANQPTQPLKNALISQSTGSELLPDRFTILYEDGGFTIGSDIGALVGRYECREKRSPKEKIYAHFREVGYYPEHDTQLHARRGMPRTVHIAGQMAKNRPLFILETKSRQNFKWNSVCEWVHISGKTIKTKIVKGFQYPASSPEP